MIEISESRAKWLGGVFEVGGSCSFDIKSIWSRGRKYKYTYSYPTLVVGDSNQEKITAFKGVLGGYVRRAGTQMSYRWSVSGRIALTLAYAMREYAPRRQEVIAAFQLWEEESDREQRLEIARAFVNSSAQGFSGESRYTELVKMPEFVAGILDMRGGIYIQTKLYHGKEFESKSAHPELRIQTVNRPLLDALKDAYGGVIYLSDVAGSVKKIQGRETILLHDSHILALRSADSERLLENAAPHLIIGKVNKPE